MLTNHDSLPFVPKEEQCNRSRTRMGSNRSTYRMNMDILNSILLPYQIRNHPRIFFTVSMADKNRLVLVLPASNPFIHHPYQFRQRFLSASDLGQKNQMPFVVHMEHRFDSCHRSHDSTQLGDPSSAVQMEQIVYGKHMTKIKFVLLQEISDFLHGFSFFFHFNRIVKQQSLAHGSTQGIHNSDRDFRIFLHQFLRGDPAAVDASAET